MAKSERQKWRERQRRQAQRAKRQDQRAKDDKKDDKPKKPKVLSSPPAGWYDPNLDAQERAAKRGLSDLIEDTDEGKVRAFSDLGLAMGDIGRQRTELGEDITRQREGLETGYKRNLSDLLTQRTQGGEDYTANLAELQRNYDRMGSAQTQNARSAGVQAGGALAQAAQKRAANQAIDKAPMDTAFNRFMESSKLGESRLGEDRKTGLSDLLRSETRGGNALTRQQGQLTQVDYPRTFRDLSKTLERGERENVAFGQDTNIARIGQATQLGWNPLVTKSPSVVKKNKGGGKGGGKKNGKKVGTVRPGRSGLGGRI